MELHSVLTVAAGGDTDHALVTVAELADFIGLAGTTSPLLVACVRQASLLAEAFCDQQFLQRTYEEVFHDRPGRYCFPIDIHLKRREVGAITSITDAAAAVVPSTDYELIDARMGRVRFFEAAPFSISADRWRMTITYVAGFQTVPQDLKLAVLQIAQKLYRQAGSTIGDVESERIGDWSASYGRAFISGPVQGALSKYKAPRLI